MPRLGQGQEVLVPSDLLPSHGYLRTRLKSGEVLRRYLGREAHTSRANILIGSPLQCALLGRGL
jgi:hypothetical protein